METLFRYPFLIVNNEVINYYSYKLIITFLFQIIKTKKMTFEVDKEVLRELLQCPK